MNGDAPLHIVVASRAVAPQHGFGGLERAVTHHLRALARRGLRLSVFTQPPHPDQPPPDSFEGMVTWYTVPYRRRQLPLRPNSIPDRLIHYAPFARTLGTAIIELCRQERVDIVHAHGLAGLGYAEGLRRPPGPPLVLNPHGLEEFSQRDRAKWLAYAPFRYGVRRVAQAAARIIATDRALVEPIGRQLGVPAERIALIPNGVAPEELDALVDQALIREISERYGLGDSSLTLVSVARLERNKGLQEGIAALGLLRDQLPSDWRWLIVGRGSEEAALRTAITQARFANNITLVGALPDAEVHSLLSCANLALVPSLYEGSSLAALEALTHRLPVVATTAGGLPDKILPGQTGFLAAPGDPAALAAALAEAFASRARWQTLGAAGRALVEGQFSWDALADDYLTLYQQLIATQR
jgi:glycosyltransferase involved in cell wall biosynthesis